MRKKASFEAKRKVKLVYPKLKIKEEAKAKNQENLRPGASKGRFQNTSISPMPL